MNQSTLHTVFTLLLNTRETHLLENFIEEHVLNLGLSWCRYTQFFHNRKILFNEFLSNIFLVIQI